MDILPFHIVCEDGLHSFAFQLFDPSDRLLGLLPIRVNATYVSVCIVPLPDFLLASQQSSVMACIAAKVYRVRIGDLRENVNVPSQMTWSVDDENRAVVENVEGMWEMLVRFPCLIQVDGRGCI